MTDSARELLSQATLLQPASITALSPLYEDPDAVEQVAIEALSATPTDQGDRVIPVIRLAAGVVAASDPFVSWLDHADATVRLVAAMACAERGEKRGVAALVDLLEEEDLDRSGHTPAPAWIEATLALARLTGELIGPPLDSDAYTRARARTRWRELLTTRDLEWSDERREWD